MAINILREMETPRHAITPDNTQDLMRGATIGHRAGLDLMAESDRIVLTRALRNPQLAAVKSVESFIGVSIGVRAARLGLEVWDEDNTGFSVVTQEDIARLRDGKIHGVRDASIRNPEVPTVDMISSTLELAGIKTSEVKTAIDFVGYSIGVRAYQLEGVAA